MDNDLYDLRVLPLNATPEQKAEPLMIENMTNSTTVEILKRSIAKKVQQPSLWREIRLFYLGKELKEHGNTLGEYELSDKQIITAMSPPGVRQKPEKRPNNPPQVKEPNEKLGSEPKGKELGCLLFKFGSRTITMDTVNLNTTVRELRERLTKERIAIQGSQGDIYFIFGGKKLAEEKQLYDYALQNESTIFVLERVLGGAGDEELHGQCSSGKTALKLYTFGERMTGWL